MDKNIPAKQYNNIDEYISLFPKNIKDILEKIRAIIIKVAPNATENISYGIPTFKLDHNLVHFAAYEKHIGLYPGPSGVEVFKEELKEYKTAKGSIQFPLDKKIPYKLIEKIVRYRVKEMRKK